MLFEPETWVAVAFVILMGLFAYLGIHRTVLKALDTRATKADQMVAPGQSAARLKEYASIFAALNKQALWVPIYHDVRYMMKSDRLVGGLPELTDPIHNIVYERLSAK